jgi:osmotically-inducible protein OsmY
VDDGVVTLTGTVDGFLKKWAAERAALRVEGVRAVVNHIGVILRGVGVRTDIDIARAVAMALEENSSVPADRIKVQVEEGRVTLEDEVDWHYQHRKAEESARRVAGVKSVTNLTTVKQPSVSADSIKEWIEQALVQHAELDAENIQVRVENGGLVVLTGTVGSWAERKEAEEAAC